MTHQAGWTHCKRGHPFDKSNTYEYKGTRNCKQCRRDAKRRFRERNRAPRWPELATPDEAGTIRVPLLNSNLVALVDQADLNAVAPFNWRLHNGYASTENYDSQSKRKRLYMHRLVLCTRLQVDHINRDKLDNRRCNLREATQRLNNFNRSIQSNNTSGFKGVSRTRNGRWWAYIRVRGKTVNLGTFDTPEEAALEYDSAALRWAGEFAWTNF